MGQIVHVLRNAEGGWRVQLDGTEQAPLDYSHQLEAIAEAKRIARRESCKLIIYKKGGEIRDVFRYGQPNRSYTGWGRLSAQRS